MPFGLSKQVPVTALLGVSFLQASKPVIAFSEDPKLHAQGIDLPLPVTCEPPALQGIPAQMDAAHECPASTQENKALRAVVMPLSKMNLKHLCVTCTA